MSQISELLERHRAFWHRDNVDKPLLRIGQYNSSYGQQVAPMSFPLADGSMAVDDVFYLEPDMLSPQRLHNIHKTQSEQPRTAGDIFGVDAPYGRVPWLEAIMGCPIRVSRQAHSMRSEHIFGDDWYEKVDSVLLDGRWINRLLEFTDYLSENSNGAYLVANTLMRGPSDMVEAMIGGDNLCTGIYEHPNELHKLMNVCTDLFIKMAKAQLDRIKPFHDGYANLFGIWAPGRSVRTQDDASALVSPDHYAEFMLSYQDRIAEQFDYSTIHLHSGSLHTVDKVLESNITAVQTSLDPQPYGPTVPELIPTFIKMQKKKPILIEGPMLKSEFDLLMKSLSPNGLYVSADMESEEDRGKRRR
ncbi:MAG: hypothetical protein AAB116_01800 [Candidatus Poribacteria bacterium]